MEKKVKALVVTSADPRYQELLHQWLAKNKLYGDHVRLSTAGCVKDRETLMKNLRMARKYFGIHSIHLLNAQGDVAYADRKFASDDMEREAHLNDLRNTKAAILAELGKLDVRLYYLTLKKGVETID